MSPTEAKNLLPVLQAYSEGKVVQWLSSDTGPEWVDFAGNDDDYDEPCLGATVYGDNDVKWRIKPTPREWWLVVGKSGFIHDGSICAEQANQITWIGNHKVVHVREVVE